MEERDDDVAGRRGGDTWRLAREIPISLLVGLMVQTAGFIWWAASLNSAVNSTALAVTKIEAKLISMEASSITVALINQRLAANEVAVGEIRAAIELVRVEQRRALYVEKPHRPGPEGRR